MIRWKYINRDELYHHGVKGQKWGVRRYQNADGSLTPAGKIQKAKLKSRYDKLSDGGDHKKYYNKDGSLNEKGNVKKAKLENKYSELTNGGKLKRTAKKASESENSKPKSISEMSNKEIQDKITRIRLENELKSLQPQQISAGKQFMYKYGDKIANRLIDYGAQTGKRIIENKLKDALGIESDDIAKLKKEVDILDLKVKKKTSEDKLNGKNTETESERLKKEAQDYENRRKIRDGQKEFKEGPYAETNDTTSSAAKTEKAYDKHSASNNHKSSKGPSVKNATLNRHRESVNATVDSMGPMHTKKSDKSKYSKEYDYSYDYTGTSLIPYRNRKRK